MWCSVLGLSYGTSEVAGLRLESRPQGLKAGPPSPPPSRPVSCITFYMDRPSSQPDSATNELHDPRQPVPELPPLHLYNRTTVPLLEDDLGEARSRPAHQTCPIIKCHYNIPWLLQQMDGFLKVYCAKPLCL